jgi:hypothetical protein
MLFLIRKKFTMNYFDLIKKTAVYLKFKEPNTFDDSHSYIYEIKLLLNSALKEICSTFPWQFRKTFTEITTNSGISEYNSPGELISLKINGQTLSLFYTYSEDYQDFGEFSGVPREFIDTNGKFILYPTPDKVYTIKIDYYTNLFAVDNMSLPKLEMDLETDNPIIPVQFQDILVWGACRDYKGDPGKGKYLHFQNKFAQLFEKMKKAHRQDVNASPVLEIGNPISSNQDLIRRFYILENFS